MFNQNFSNEFTETRIALTVIPSHLANIYIYLQYQLPVPHSSKGKGVLGGKHVKTPTTTTYLCLHFCLACVMMSLYVMKKREVEEDYHDKGCDFNLFLAICFRLKGREIVLVHPQQKRSSYTDKVKSESQLIFVVSLLHWHPGVTPPSWAAVFSIRHSNKTS